MSKTWSLLPALFCLFQKLKYLIFCSRKCANLTLQVTKYFSYVPRLSSGEECYERGNGVISEIERAGFCARF